MTLMMPEEIKQAFVKRGWVKGAGGDLYFNGSKTTAHPHLHLKTSSIHSGLRPMVGRDIRLAVCMLAYSDGQRGRTFLSEAGERVSAGWRDVAARCPMSEATAAEFFWIMSYFTEG